MSYTKTLIDANRAAEILAMKRDTLYKGKAGTEGLTRVQFGRSVKFILQEVEALKERQIRRATGSPVGSRTET